MRIKEIVPVSISDLIDNDLEGFLDLLEMRITKVTYDLLCDVQYRPVGINADSSINIEVIADRITLNDAEDL